MGLRPCDTAKLPEPPATVDGTAPRSKEQGCTSVKVEGMVTIRQLGTIGSQVLRATRCWGVCLKDAVHRLDGGGSPVSRRLKI